MENYISSFLVAFDFNWLSRLLRENLVALLVSNMTALLENVLVSTSTSFLSRPQPLSSSIVNSSSIHIGSGAVGVPPVAIAVTAGILIFVNAILYCVLMHVLYTIILRVMGMTRRANGQTDNDNEQRQNDRMMPLKLLRWLKLETWAVSSLYNNITFTSNQWWSWINVVRHFLYLLMFIIHSCITNHCCFLYQSVQI